MLAGDAQSHADVWLISILLAWYVVYTIFFTRQPQIRFKNSVDWSPHRSDLNSHQFLLCLLSSIQIRVISQRDMPHSSRTLHILFPCLKYSLVLLTQPTLECLSVFTVSTSSRKPSLTPSPGVVAT